MTILSTSNAARRLCWLLLDESFAPFDSSSSTSVWLPTAADAAVLQWNVTWVPPSSRWLVSLGKAWPGVHVEFATYNHVYDQQVTFRWSRVLRVFQHAAATGVLKVPLACIQGRSELRLDEESTVCSVTEKLAYADDLRSGRLLNRRCAEDLRDFLEAGRRHGKTWDSVVEECLPWASVPGFGTLDVEPQDESPALFIGATVVALALFSSAVAFELLGT